MGFRRFVVSYAMKGLLSIICKIDCREFVEALKENKPLLVVLNHINFLEVPILVTHSYPIYVSGLVKSETWNNPIFSFISNTYKAIPIDRKKSFIESFKHVCEAIENGYYMCVAPEGTRSRDGVLGKGKAGIIQLAIEANVPILPIAHYGGENIWKNIRRFRRTPFYFKAGRPFRIKVQSLPGHKEREEIMTEVMVQIARLLPEKMRGVYSQQTQNECKYLEFC
jgi:1-acyl-sn-glycerol-3-phosphate acyltransferase